MDTQKIFTVTEINASIRGILETRFPFVSVAGEISNLRRPVSGHIYFTLKDEDSQIKAVLFKMQQRYLSEPPADGRLVICRGRISVYEPRGDYQIIVDAMDFHGAGLLQLEYEKLKKKLADEGLFAAHRKKPIPGLPGHVVVVTSPRGAAVHDFLQVARSRFPLARISIFPVPVQGRQAAGEISAALDTINRSMTPDVIVLCRGGGSLEDLWSFNDEKVVRAVAASQIPVVCGVGHEVDFTLADLAADLRAPTPSAAAEMILPDRADLRRRINALSGSMVRMMSARLERGDQVLTLQRHRLGSLKQRFDNLLIRLDHLSLNMEKAVSSVVRQKQAALDHASARLQANNPLNKLVLRRRRLDELKRQLIMAARRRIRNAGDQLGHAAGMLDAVSPLSILGRGYAIVRKETTGRGVVKEHREVEAGDRVEVTLHRGYLDCTVENTREGKKK
jgi:exodeoxyribonuclease VII large subunit